MERRSIHLGDGSLVFTDVDVSSDEREPYRMGPYPIEYFCDDVVYGRYLLHYPSEFVDSL